MGNAAKPGLIILVCGILGLLVAFIEQLAYANSYLLNQYLTSSSDLVALQILSIVVFLLAGCALAALSS